LAQRQLEYSIESVLIINGHFFEESTLHCGNNSVGRYAIEQYLMSYMKKIFLLLLINLGSYHGHAQSLEHDRDSFKLSLQNEKIDTSRVLTLATLVS